MEIVQGAGSPPQLVFYFHRTADGSITASMNYVSDVTMDLDRFLLEDEDVRRQEMKIGYLKKEIAKKGVEGMINRFEDHEDVSEKDMKRAIREWEERDNYDN